MPQHDMFCIHVPWQRSMAALLRENAVKVCVLQPIDTNARDLGSKPPFPLSIPALLTCVLSPFPRTFVHTSSRSREMASRI